MRGFFQAIAAWALLLFAMCQAHAADFSVEGYGDARVIAPADETTWYNGALGKTRWGGDKSPDWQISELFAQARAQITSEISAVLGVRASPGQRSFVEALEAYVKWRPVSTTNWRFELKAGAFFPPVSLENDEIGWTSTWTLTPSAINSWVGDELRTIGSEAMVEYRQDERTISLRGAIYEANDPAGVLIAEHGWTFDDKPTGLFDHPRIPDVEATALGEEIPDHTTEFQEIDHRPGYYAGATWDEKGIVKVSVLRYDNRADPTAKAYDTIAWDTKFWSVGAATEIWGFTLMAQGMKGSTYIEPSPTFESETYFNAAYGLVGYDFGEWRLAGRYDRFYNSQENDGPKLPWAESGHAYTLALSWLPYEWLRMTAEFLTISSTRSQRTFEHINPHQIENQAQLSARVYF
jgi:hypothetical protein